MTKPTDQRAMTPTPRTLKDMESEIRRRIDNDMRMRCYRCGNNPGLCQKHKTFTMVIELLDALLAAEGTQPEKDHGAELAAGVNDTGSSTTETASDECNDCANSRFADDCHCLREYLEREHIVSWFSMPSAPLDGNRVILWNGYRRCLGWYADYSDGSSGWHRQNIIGEPLGPRDIEPDTHWTWLPRRPLAGNQPSTDVSSAPAASPAQKEQTHVDLAEAGSETRPICGKCGQPITPDEPSVGRNCESRQYHLRDCRRG